MQDIGSPPWKSWCRSPQTSTVLDLRDVIYWKAISVIISVSATIHVLECVVQTACVGAGSVETVCAGKVADSMTIGVLVRAYWSTAVLIPFGLTVMVRMK